MPLTTEEANAILPQEKTKAVIDPARLKYFLVAPPKFGKTTTATMIPDSLLLAFEEGHAFTETHKIIIDQWDRPMKEKALGVGVDEDGNTHMSMMEAMQAIIASDRFTNIIFDTADMMVRMCVDYHCAKLGVAHPQDAGDYGKGYAIVLADPVRRMIGPIIKSGRGLFFISHSKLVQKVVGGVTSAKYESTLASQAQAFIHSQCDLILQGKFGKHRPGHEDRDRILCTDASEHMMAGSRVRFGGKTWPIPKNFILDPDNGWEQWASFFPTNGVSEKEARDNCERAYQDYLSLTVSKRVKEKEDIASETGGPETSQPASPETTSAAATDSSEAPPSEEPTPEYLTGPKNLRRKPVAKG